jgi:hypothetical protein
MQLHDNPFMLEEILSKAPEGCPTMAFLDGKPKLPPAGQVLPIGMRYNFSTFRVWRTTLHGHSAKPVICICAAAKERSSLLSALSFALFELLKWSLFMFRLTGTLVTHSAPAFPDCRAWHNWSQWNAWFVPVHTAMQSFWA